MPSGGQEVAPPIAVYPSSAARTVGLPKDDPTVHQHVDENGPDTPPPARREIIVTQADRDAFRRNLDEGRFTHRRAVRDVATVIHGEFISKGTEAELAAKEEGSRAYKWYDSPLEFPPGEVLDSNLSTYPYAFDFGGFAELGQTYKNYLQGRIPDGAVGVDIGGPGSRLFGDFDPGKFAATYGMTLTDVRTDEQKARDAERGHNIIPGNFQEKWGELDEKLGGRGVNAMFIRLLGGDDMLPQDPYKQFGEFGEAYSRVDDNDGLLTLNVPKLCVPLALPWFRRVRKEAGDALPIRASVGLGAGSLVFEITKTLDSPVTLPKLTSREVMAAYGGR